ncbi:hypothetical protein [Hydrogenophaga sp. PAMC20947]|nr:hypothetical protein [Hydrogenophaga sp. PAMC20947]
MKPPHRASPVPLAGATLADLKTRVGGGLDARTLIRPCPVKGNKHGAQR